MYSFLHYIHAVYEGGGERTINMFIASEGSGMPTMRLHAS